jgi:hypothetical protein
VKPLRAIPLLLVSLTGCEAIVGSHDLTLATTDASATDAVTDNAVDAAGDAAADVPPVPGHLEGADALPPSLVHLTNVGTTDWAHWGLVAVDSFSDKATGGGEISDRTVIGSSSPSQYANDQVGYSWNDGTPQPKIADSTTGILVAGLGNGFSFSVAANTQLERLQVYVGGFNSGGSIVAHLSDSSAADYTDSTHSGGKNGYDVAYTLSFNAATAGQSLTVTWTMAKDMGKGSVALESAALE